MTGVGSGSGERGRVTGAGSGSGEQGRVSLAVPVRQQQPQQQLVRPFSLSAPPPLPEGKTMLDLQLNTPVDLLFQMIFTEGEFFNSWLNV